MDQNSESRTPTRNAQQDRLSSLPDGIMADILSLVPTNTDVSTSVLSSRWRYLWTQVSYFHLDYSHFPQQTSDFYTVVDQFLIRLTSPILRTFSLRAPYPRHQHFEPWMRYLCVRHVEKIDILVAGPGAPNDSTPFILPNCIFRTRTLVCLNLPTYHLDYEFPEDVDIINLPNLKRLAFTLTASRCGFVAKLLRSCPLLEDLTLKAVESWGNKLGQNDDDNGAIINISCGNLKQLQLILLGVPRNTKVVIDAPKLGWFCLFSSSFTCSFVKKPDGIHEAVIFTAAETPLLSFLPMISNVRVLHIPAVAFGRFEAFKDNQGNSIFHKLTHLGLHFGREGFDDPTSFPFEITSPSPLLRIKNAIIGVRSVKCWENFKKLTEYVVSNAPALKSFDVDVHLDPYQSNDKVNYQREEMMFCIYLYSYSRNYSKCAIEFRGQHAKLPASIAELQEMENHAQQLLGNS